MQLQMFSCLFFFLLFFNFAPMKMHVKTRIERLPPEIIWPHRKSNQFAQQTGLFKNVLLRLRHASFLEKLRAIKWLSSSTVVCFQMKLLNCVIALLCLWNCCGWEQMLPPIPNVLPAFSLGGNVNHSPVISCCNLLCAWLAFHEPEILHGGIVAACLMDFWWSSVQFVNNNIDDSAVFYSTSWDSLRIS